CCYAFARLSSLVCHAAYNRRDLPSLFSNSLRRYGEQFILFFFISNFPKSARPVLSFFIDRDFDFNSEFERFEMPTHTARSSSVTKRRLLLIDDSPDNLEVLSILLSDKYDVV